MPGTGVRNASIRAALLAAWAGSRVGAHDPGLSYASVRLEGTRIEVEVSYARADLEPLLGAAPMDELARRAFDVVASGQPAAVERAGVRFDDHGAVRLELELALPEPGPMSLRSGLLEELPRGHKQYLTV